MYKLFMCVLISLGSAGCYNLCKPAWHDEAVWRHLLSLEDQQSGYGEKKEKAYATHYRKTEIDLYTHTHKK